MQHRFRAPLVLPADPACSLIRDGVVDVDDTGHITHCGPAATAPETSAPVVQLTGILLPGLVNTHAHSPMTLLRGIGGGAGRAGADPRRRGGRGGSGPA